MLQIKEQENNPGKQKNPKEMKISNLPDKEFKEMVISMLSKLESRGAQREPQQRKNVIKDKSELKKTITTDKKIH